MKTLYTVDGTPVPQYNPHFTNGDRVLFDDKLSGKIMCFLDDICIVQFDAINGVYPVVTNALKKEVK